MDVPTETLAVGRICMEEQALTLINTIQSKTNFFIIDPFNLISAISLIEKHGGVYSNFAISNEVQ